MFRLLVSILLASSQSVIGIGIDGTSFNGGMLQLLGTPFGTPGINASFDYVIVGGGVAGLTVARRLAANPKLSVAVVEAGAFYEVNGNFTQVPGYESQYIEAPATMDWMIHTTNQTQLAGQSVLYPQGKCLGGSSGRNGMAYQRGTIGSYQMWADAVGDQSFTFSNLLKYFQRSVHFTPPDYSKRGGPQVAYQVSAYSSSGGPLNVAYWNYYAPVATFLRKGLEKLGFKETSGIASGSILGYAQYPATLEPRSQTRDSSETSFGREMIMETSGTLYVNSLAKRILFDQAKKAVGVQVDSAGSSFTLTANKEVIVASGAFRSPQMLLVSGIGPKADLQKLNIPVVADLPGVGNGLEDNPAFSVIIPVNVTTEHQLYSNTSYYNAAKEAYINNQNGPLAAFASNYIGWDSISPSTPNNTNFSPSTISFASSFPKDWPDFQYIFNTVGTITNTSSDPFNQVAIVYSILKTKSRGSVTISSPDTADNPIVNINWLNATEDQQLAIEATKRARKLSNAIGIKSGPEAKPGEGVKSDAQILKVLKAGVGPTHHASSSCRMGKASDPMAVVDAQGKVYGGVKGLRVVDISVFPSLPPGQPMSTVYALAEKLAEDILMGR